MLLDIDECSTGDHNCTQNQRCVDKPGTFICECINGYELLNGVCEGNRQRILMNSSLQSKGWHITNYVPLSHHRSNNSLAVVILIGRSMHGVMSVASSCLRYKIYM